MPARIAAVSAVAASLFATALPVAAADLYEVPWSHYGDTYYDNGKTYHRHGRHTRWRYDSEHRNFDGHDFDYPVPPRSVYGGKGFRGKHYRSHYHNDCVSRRVARKRLRADGWSHFRPLERRQHVVLVQARRSSGRIYDLTIDRCSGEIVDACPLNGDRDFAYRRSRY